VFLWRSVTC